MSSYMQEIDIADEKIDSKTFSDAEMSDTTAEKPVEFKGATLEMQGVAQNGNDPGVEFRGA